MLRQKVHSLATTKADSGCVILCVVSLFFFYQLASDSGCGLEAACAVTYWTLKFSKKTLRALVSESVSFD